MKLKIRNIFIILFLFFIVFFIIYFKVIKNNNESKDTLNNNSYSSKSIKQIKKLNIKNKINLNKYSKVLDIAIYDSHFDIDNVSYYENVDYVKVDDIINIINSLAKEGLAINEINDILKNFAIYQNYEINNSSRYVSYKILNEELTNQDVVTRVNLNLDKPFYTDTKRIADQDNIYALVNKYNYLDMNYVPKNLKALFNIQSLKLVDVAADAYEEFIKAAKKDGISLIGTTAYRSATWQKELYDSYVNKDGKEKADTYSARPGYSEHQLGYSVDLNDPTFTGKRLTDEDYTWIKNNAYKYGFIIRYPENSENITGYMHENWHIRYVGKDVALKIHELGITFDEYYDLYLK